MDNPIQRSVITQRLGHAGATGSAMAAVWAVAAVLGCAGSSSDSGSGGGPSTGTGGNSASGGSTSSGGATSSGGVSATGGTTSTGGASASGGATSSGGATATGGASSTGGNPGPGGTSSSAGGGGRGGAAPTGGKGGAAGRGGSTATGDAGGALGTGGAGGSVGVSIIAGPLATGITWKDDNGDPVNAHGGGINREGDTFYMSGEYFVYKSGASYDQNNSFKAFAMYSTRDLMNWKFEKKILSQQPSGELGPNRIGERPHIIKCPATGEFVLVAHAASIDYQTDKEAVYATSATINGDYAYKGPLKDASGGLIVHSDMSAYVDGNTAYVITESGNVYKLAEDCHSWTTHTSYSAMANMESPTVFKAGSSYFWLMSNKTGWRANDNEYASASSMTGPWTNQGLVAPTGERTWLSQSTCVLPIVGSSGTAYLYWGDHWAGTEDMSGATSGKNNSLAAYVFQPIVVNGAKISMPMYYASWKLDIAAGTWSP